MRWEPFRIILIVATLSCLVILVHVRQPQARTRQLLGLSYLFGLSVILFTPAVIRRNCHLRDASWCRPSEPITVVSSRAGLYRKHHSDVSLRLGN